ncbi:MAG: C10 family peptidase [Bacteroidales bacterium]|nr:C10 family peptidase [Bacteroidales bacterium]
MKIQRFVLFLILIPVLMSARTLTKNEMTTLGTRAFQQKAQQICPEAASYSLKDCEYLRDGGEISMAVLHFDHGFLLLSAEDAVMPVLAYDFTNDIDLSNLAPGVEFLLSQYQNEIAVARSENLAQSERVAEAWRELRHPSRSVTTEVVVAPLITARWNQNKYYNYYSPQDENAPGGYDGKVPNGCVAVAMSQIIYYYRYPESGTGSHTNYTYDYGSFYVNFAQQHYNYEAMDDQLSSYNNEVAKLIFHCATSVDMGYGADGSGAYSHDVPAALSTYFRYNTDSQYRHKNSYSDSAWHVMLKTDLDAKRPIYYSGYSESGGHAFVCDGYNSDDYFHFNFGWGGSGNGYYVTQSNDSVNNAVNGYEHGQNAIFNLHPLYNNYPRYCEDKTITSTNGTLEDGSGNLDYQNNTYCTYVITGQLQYAVDITLKKLSSQENHDYLRFWNGHPSQDSLLAELSGSVSNFSHQFSTDSLYITFETDDSVTAEGWHLSYHSLREGIGCGVYNTHDHTGVIYDNSGDDYNYRDNMTCRWMIRLSNVPFITFTFEELDISPEDHLEFYDMATYPYELLGSFTGNENPGTVTYYASKIQVAFNSDNYLNAAGFKVLWSASDVGIEDFVTEMSVLPNPASDILHITLSEPLDHSVVTLYNMVGQAVFAQEYDNADHIEIPVNQLTNGIYVLSMESGGRTLHQKIVIRH